ncbi:hypothetical protein N7376_24870, partial [Brucella intermedia GD04153]
MKSDPDGDYVTRSQAEELLAAERAKKEMLAESLHIQIKRVNELEADNAAKDETIRRQDIALRGALLEFERLKAELDFVGRVKGVNEKYANALAFLEMTENDDPEEFAECFWNKFIAIEADNAAQAARIKELEEALDSDPSGSDLWRYWSRKACETSQKYVDEVNRAEAIELKLAAAEKALEPFADIADLIDAETEGMAETDELVLHFHDYEFAKWPVSFFRKARAAR